MLSRRAAALDKPRYGKSRYPFDLSTPQHKLHPGRSRWGGTKYLCDRADPPLLTFETSQEGEVPRHEINVRPCTKSYIAGLGIHFVGIDGLGTFLHAAGPGIALCCPKR